MHDAKVTPVCLNLTGLDRSPAPPISPCNLSVSVNSAQMTGDCGKTKDCGDSLCSYGGEDLQHVRADLQIQMNLMLISAFPLMCADFMSTLVKTVYSRGLYPFMEKFS